MTSTDPPTVSRRGFLATSVTSVAAGAIPASTGMSAVALVREGHDGSEAEIREFMSGKMCRCGAYPNIVEAVGKGGSS